LEANLVNTYGVTEVFESGDFLDEAIVELLIKGYTLIPSGFSDTCLSDLSQTLDLVYEKQCEELGGEDVLKEINDADQVRCCLSYDSSFMDVATNTNLINFCKKVFGDEYLLLMQNGIINKPNQDNFQAKWHRDLNYQHWTASRVIAINALLCIDEFNSENGATYVLPASNHCEKFPTSTYVKNHELQISAKPGDFILLDAMLFHRAGVNISKKSRRAINHVIGRPFLAQQINIPSALNEVGIYKNLSLETKKYLGYRWMPASNALEWRSRRIKK